MYATLPLNEGYGEMALLSTSERRVVDAIAGIGYANPFLPERIERERRALGAAFIEAGPIIHAQAGARIEEMFPNSPALERSAGSLARALRQRLCAGSDATDLELVLYEDLSLYLLYSRYMSRQPGIAQLENPDWVGPVAFWPEFLADFRALVNLPERSLPSQHRPEHIFAGFFQIERAFRHIFEDIVGRSMPAARLRAAVWQSIFTHDMRRYARTLYRHMGDIPTLVTGPSGTGKELVARAIGLSRYIAFNPRTKSFAEPISRLFFPLNLSALAPTLIESELFGHVKGAFSGAVGDRTGWLDENVCGASGTVFLDEIGELDEGIQVKLLRVLQSRTFQKVGGTETRRFAAKIIAATNRDMAGLMRAGRFRPDLYYRLCADVITTPSLHEQLEDHPDDLLNLVRFLAARVLPGEGEEGDSLANEVVEWIDSNLGRDYAWPGNFRELEQCVRNVLIRKQYRPAALNGGDEPGGPVERFLEQVRSGSLTSDKLVEQYCALVYHQTGSYKLAGARLGVDWRTVRSRLDRDLLAAMGKANST
jgi:DNA-binding NtrC family response regulator